VNYKVWDWNNGCRWKEGLKVESFYRFLYWKFLLYPQKLENIFLFLTKIYIQQIVWRNREDQSVIKHLNAQGKPDPRGGLHCFWCPNRSWTPPLYTFDTVIIIKVGLEMRKLWPLKVKVSKTQKNKPPNITKAGSWTLKKFFVCCSIAIEVPASFLELHVTIL
jgi:hypothetical protein